MEITSTTCPVVLLSAPLWFKRHELFSVFSYCYPGFKQCYPSIIYIYVYMLYFILVKRTLRSLWVCTILTKDPPLFCEYGITAYTCTYPLSQTFYRRESSWFYNHLLIRNQRKSIITFQLPYTSKDWNNITWTETQIKNSSTCRSKNFW